MTFWKSKGVSTKLLYVVGIDQESEEERSEDERGKEERNEERGEEERSEDERGEDDDIIVADLVECRCNLRHKVQIGLRYIRENFSFDYVLKTDIDVFNNYKAWTNSILRHRNENSVNIKNIPRNKHDSNQLDSTEVTLKYGGASCHRHPGVKYPFCAGMGYLIHSSQIDHVIDYPLSRMEGAEDRTVGKCMFEQGVRPVQLLNGTVRARMSKERCESLGVLMKEQGALHVGDVKKMSKCWKLADLSLI